MPTKTQNCLAYPPLWWARGQLQRRSRPQALVADVELDQFLEVGGTITMQTGVDKHTQFVGNPLSNWEPVQFVEDRCNVQDLPRCCSWSGHQPRSTVLDALKLVELGFS